MVTQPSKIFKSQKGRPYRVVKVEKISNTEKWVNRVLKYHWSVLILFLDDDGGKLELIYDYNDKLIKKVVIY